MSSPSHTSSTLLESIRLRDQQAWERFVSLYGPSLYRWCRAARLTEDDAADVIQETYRAVANGIHRFERARGQRGSFTAWLWKVTQSKILNHRQRSARGELAVGGSEARQYLAEMPDPINSPADAVSLTSEHSPLMCAVEVIREEFTESTWQAFWRVAVDDQPTDVVAEQLQLSVAAVRQANYRVRRRLRKELEFLGATEPADR